MHAFDQFPSEMCVRVKFIRSTCGAQNISADSARGGAKGACRPVNSSRYRKCDESLSERNCVPLFSAHDPQRDMIKEGDSAPDFDLETDEGTRIALSTLRGRNVVLFFYPKDNTSG
jgi:hypothetical protein